MATIAKDGGLIRASLGFFLLLVFYQMWHTKI